MRTSSSKPDCGTCIGCRASTCAASCLRSEPARLRSERTLRGGHLRLHAPACALLRRSRTAERVLAAGLQRAPHRASDRNLLDYVLSEPFAAVIFDYTRQHAHFFVEAGLRNVYWLPGFNVRRIVPQIGTCSITF